jgi:uncharacterized protein (TIGR00251 family)
MRPPEARLVVEVRARAGRDAIVGWRARVLQVRVAAPPADGAANEAVRTLLAERLGWPRGRVEIVRGHTSRTKALRVIGLSPDELARRLGGPAQGGGAPGRLPSAPGGAGGATRSPRLAPATRTAGHTA